MNAPCTGISAGNSGPRAWARADREAWRPASCVARKAALVAYAEEFSDFIVAVHGLKLGSPTLMASSRDVSDDFWAGLADWAERHRPTDDARTRAFTLAAARAVFSTAFELWDADRGIGHCVALICQGFAEAGAGFASAPA